MTQARGEVFDIGYQRYTGVREGRVRALKTLWSNGVRTSLGIGRGLFAKIIPGMVFLILLIPALIFPVLNAMLGEAAEFVDLIPGQDEYYTAWFAFVFILFTAIVGPELLIADRRSGVINLYLVRPLTTTDYVLGRWLAFFSVALAMLLIPQLTLFVGLALGAESQVDYISVRTGPTCRARPRRARRWPRSPQPSRSVCQRSWAGAPSPPCSS